jgi:hypothetical protein
LRFKDSPGKKFLNPISTKKDEPGDKFCHPSYMRGISRRTAVQVWMNKKILDLT